MRGRRGVDRGGAGVRGLGLEERGQARLVGEDLGVALGLGEGAPALAEGLEGEGLGDRQLDQAVGQPVLERGDRQGLEAGQGLAGAA